MFAVENLCVVLKIFPKNLITPIDEEYMKKLVRRARQNKSKRDKSAAARQSAEEAAATSPASSKQQGKVASENENDNDEESADEEGEYEVEEEVEEPSLKYNTLVVPQRGLVFAEVKFNLADFGG